MIINTYPAVDGSYIVIPTVIGVHRKYIHVVTYVLKNS